MIVPEAQRLGIEMQARRQIASVGKFGRDENTRLRQRAAQVRFGLNPCPSYRAKRLCPGEEQNITIKVDIVAKGLTGQNRKRRILKPANDIIKQDRPIVARCHGNADITLIGATFPVADRIGKACRTVEIFARGEMDHAILGEFDASVGREPFKLNNT